MANSSYIRLTDYGVKPGARAVVSGTLHFSNITHKNTRSKYTPTYGVTIDNPQYSIPSDDNNNRNLVKYLQAHAHKELVRHGKNRIHLTWKGAKGAHMPIAGQATQDQFTPQDGANLLARRDEDGFVIDRSGNQIMVNGQPTKDVSKIPDADDKVAFNQLAAGQQVKVTYESFAAKNYNNRTGSTVRALVVKDSSNLDLFTGGNSNISSFGLGIDGNDTGIQINSDPNQAAVSQGTAPTKNPFAKPQSNNQGQQQQAPVNNNNNNNNQQAQQTANPQQTNPQTNTQTNNPFSQNNNQSNNTKNSNSPSNGDLPF